MYQLIFSPEAGKEFTEALLWYKEQKAGLEDRLYNLVNITIKKIKANPETFGYSKKPYREATVPIFPYSIVYVVNKHKRIIYVSAIFHNSRNPKKKFRKL